ncbi:LysM peptidoglycan-binding domain-containing protein [Streptomyces griseorubiginosus]|uniref:LysM peptidoglycan-binding domain-containing protein n=1 Tax=Streptomyces griseorubiginosus TaxID=67304 RepID=UPI001AD6361B|nr:LysM peptidoglycan-binding domain-containing protein [Streptomyces griseorubiginosus]MBO4260240.1 LysM peptidoglycan-binding domain-containing protein [Streptomyces griseorubiginosus]
MPATPSPAAAAGRVLGRLFKAVLSLLVLAVAVAGLPLLLAWATPIIWAATHDDLTHLLDRQDTGAAFLLLLIAVSWVGWGQFTFCVVRELLAQLRGRTWHAPRGLGTTQRAAALLIGSILVLLPTSSALASDAQAAPASTAAHIPGQAAPTPAPTQTEGAAPSAVSTPASRPSYTVRDMRPAESLWGIAERELGDGERWREIADLNEGHTMIDGTVFRANSFLQPGWQLAMPTPARGPGGVRAQLDEGLAAAGEGNEHVVPVHSGDYLSKIAERELGDGSQWPRLFEASKGKPQPHGLPPITAPDMIYPGQQVTVPEAAPDRAAEQPGSEQTPTDGSNRTPRPSHTTTPESPAPSPPGSRPAEQPGQEQGSPETAAATPQPGTSASAEPSASAAASPSASAEPSESGASSPTAAPSPAPANGPLGLRTVLGAGALLAAAITGALAVRRTLQRRRRRPGEAIAIASETSPAEAKLAAAAAPDGAARLDVALRTLAHHVASQQGAELPHLRAARMGTGTVQVLPGDLTQEPLAPFVSGDGGWWVLDAAASLLDEEAARDVPAPYPGLVTIGHTPDGDLLLLNLTRMPALLLDGNPVHITEVCTSLALELGMSPWAGDVEVVTIGFGEDLPQLLPTTRIAHMRQATHALRDLGERLLEAHQMPETSRQPYLLLCASSLDPDTAWAFADVIDKASPVPVTLVAPASAAAPHLPHAEILNASLSNPQQLDTAGVEITLQRLDHDAYRQITTALKMSAQPAHPATGPWQDVPDETDVSQPIGTTTDTVPQTDAGPSPAPAADAKDDVFPALLAASTDPSALRLLSHAASSPQPGDEMGPGAEAAVSSAPASPAAAETPDAAETDAPGAAVEKPAQQDEAQDLHAPEIRVLGPLEVTGVDSTGHGPRTAQLAALLLFRPGRSADMLCSDMDPVHPWSTSTLNARIQGLRRALGNNPAGEPYVPRRTSGNDPYRLADAVRCDWMRFLQLVEHALPQGPLGLDDLEEALTLVRGRPFGGKPLPWAEPYLQDMVTRIIDVAHTVATYRTPHGPHHDLSAARRAVATGLDVDDTSELLYRDWLKIEHAAGNRHGLHTAISRVQQINRDLDCSLELETEQLINHLLGSLHPHGTGS